ncbi:MAG: hypothetical protein QN191_10375, partial [Armatimonadota bacterium]|nr:hypothetical protein [Armatimonadota bacterium]
PAPKPELREGVDGSTEFIEDTAWLKRSRKTRGRNVSGLQAGDWYHSGGLRRRPWNFWAHSSATPKTSA